MASDRSTTAERGRLARLGAERAATAAAIAAGIPPPLTRLVVQRAAPFMVVAARRQARFARRLWLTGGAAMAAIAVVVAAISGIRPQIDAVVTAQRTTPAARADIPAPYLTAYQRAAASVRPPIPWEILAGVGKVATDHGRRSPYDDIDRETAPNASYPEVIPPIASAPPAAAVAGPSLNPVTPALGAPDTELATDPNNVEVFLAGERQVESGGNYALASSAATGAYQYIDSTWASEARSAGYPQYASNPASAAPPTIQDSVAAYNAEHLFAQYRNWWWVAEAWYFPRWAGDPAEQSSVPYPEAGNTLTMARYARAVYSAMATSTAVPSTAVPPAAAPTPGPSGPAGPSAPEGSGPLLLTPEPDRPAGAELQAVDRAADLLARAAGPVEEQTWQRLGLPSSIVDRPLDDPDARRFWAEVLPRLPVANGVGIGQPATPGGPADTLPASGPEGRTPAPGPGDGDRPMARFATDLLTNLTLPVTGPNVAALQAWASGEGSQAAFNPLDTTQAEPGATAFNANGGVPVENYPDYRTGLAATVATLEPGGRPAPLYAKIIDALRAGSSAEAVESAVAASPWGTRAFPDPSFQALANFPGLPASLPAGGSPVILTDLRGAAPGTTRSVASGVDAHAPADALTMAAYYAGVTADVTPAAGAQYAATASVPADYRIPPGTAGAVSTAISMAEAQLGKPYVYGAEGPDSYDCSGLVMAAYASAGISLPRTTYDQYLAGQAVAVGDPQGFRAGDLLFLMGSDARGAAPGHVGMYLGAGQVIDAPYTGSVVHISPIESWIPKLVTVRRVVAQ